jgi:hypothetical protein
MENSTNTRSQHKKLFNIKIYDYNMHGENVENVKQRMFNLLNESDDFLMILVCASANSRDQDPYMEIFLRSIAATTEAELTTWLFDEFFNITDEQIFLQHRPPKFAFSNVKNEAFTCSNACKSDIRPLHLRIPNSFLS